MYKICIHFITFVAILFNSVKGHKQVETCKSPIDDIVTFRGNTAQER